MTPTTIAEFLGWLRPGGFVPLSALSPDGKFWTHTPCDYAAAEQWALKTNKTASVYFALNPTREPMEKNAEKTDVARAEWLHIDVDPRSGDDRDTERARILALLTTNRPANVPAPTLLWDSGNGYQAAWLLREPVELNGDTAVIEAVESRNRWLEKVFQADSCHNINRVLRLPFSINRPTKKKAAKGRVAAPSVLIECEPTRTYTLDDFGQVLASTSSVVNKKPPSGTKAQRPSPHLGDGNGLDVDGLTAWATANGNKTIKDETLALIATGDHPTEPGRYGSRSEVLFRVCCDLVRADVPDDVIFGVITGPNAIAASVRDKPNPTTYAIRQIERARDLSTAPELLELNDKHAVIADMGGKCLVISEVFDKTLNRYRLSKQSFDTIRNRYSNRRVVIGMDEQGNAKTKPLGGWWLENLRRRQYERIVFAPGGSSPDEYNLWQGFAVEAKPGDKHQSFLAHLRDNVCSGNAEHFAYLVGWMARAVQEPDSPGEVAVVMRGARGTGKSFFGKSFGKLFGRHYLQVANPKHLVGQFNAHLRDTVLLFGDEAFFAGDRQHEGVLKTLITEEQVIVEGKGVDAEPWPNYTHLILASNDAWVVPAGVDERRFFVLDVSDNRKQDHDFFAAISEDLAHGGLENLLHYLRAYDLSGYEVRRVPKTEALADQQAESLRGIERYVFDLLWTAEPPMSAVPYWRDERILFVPSSALREGATEYLRGLFGKQHVSFEAIRSLLSGKLGAMKDRESAGRREYGYVWDMGAMRAAWSTQLFAVKWSPLPAAEEKPPF
ncbi:MAG TPA: DUF5906 domain-containing protein [Luteimonas sp.]|nr:DUF5906 domain-containing protein [Luteimonas sp.]